MNKIFTKTIGLLLLVWVGACASGEKILPSLVREVGETSSMELQDVPFYPQERYQCGPAALATLLKASGVEVLPEQLTAKIFLPERKGSLQVELLAATRRYGRIPYVIEPELMALLEEIRVGRPVLVLQNLGFERWPTWHYAAVVGYDAARDILILRSGKESRQLMSAREFLMSWRSGGFWGLVVLRPGELPASPDHDRYLETLAQMDPASFSDLLIPGYQAALEYWPESDVSALGLGNAWFAVGQPEKAAEVFKNYLLDKPNHDVIRNNLAEVLASLGKYKEALQEIDKALELSGKEDPFYPVFLQTRGKILKQMIHPGL